VDTPDIKGRDQIFRVHLAKLKLEKALTHYSGTVGPLVQGAAPVHLFVCALLSFECTWQS
jgi:ATP-dependent Zn protease